MSANLAPWPCPTCDGEPVRYVTGCDHTARERAGPGCGCPEHELHCPDCERTPGCVPCDWCGEEPAVGVSPDGDKCCEADLDRDAVLRRASA